MNIIKIRATIAVLALMLSSFGATGEERRRLDDVDARELREAYLTYIRAIRNNDVETAKGWIGAGQGHEDGVLMTEILLASNAFQDAMIMRFGEEVARGFPGQSDRQIEKIEKNVSDPATKVEGFERFATISQEPEQEGPLTAIGFAGDIQIMARKLNGRWQQIPEPTDEKAVEERKRLKELLKVLTDLVERINTDEDITEESVRATINKVYQGE